MAAALYGTKIGLLGAKHRATGEDYAEMSLKVSTVFQYCKSYIKFIRDFTMTGWNWEDGKEGANGEYELFNRDYINALWDLASRMETAPEAELRQQCEELSRGDLIPGWKIDNTALQAHLGEEFSKIRTNYAATTKPEVRVADYLNLLYTACKDQLKSR